MFRLLTTGGTLTYCPQAAAIAVTEASKELVALGMLIETARDGIPLDEIGMPAKTTGSMKLHLYNDGKAAISISTMEGLLRRVKHMELRAHYVKYLHRRRRLTLEHWEGVSNPSDGLTKSCKLAAEPPVAPGFKRMKLADGKYLTAPESWIPEDPSI